MLFRSDIVHALQGRRQPPFRWFDFGSMAVVGPLFAVADLRGLRLSGPLGWLLWGVAHLMFMPARENRVTLLTKWLWLIATRERSSMLITGRSNQHLGVEVGLELAPQEPASPAPVVSPETGISPPPAAA